MANSVYVIGQLHCQCHCHHHHHLCTTILAISFYHWYFIENTSVKQSMKHKVCSNFQMYLALLTDVPPVVGSSGQEQQHQSVQLYIFSFGVQLWRGKSYIAMQEILVLENWAIYVHWSFCCCCCCCLISFLLLFICNCGCTITDEQQQKNYTVTTTIRTKYWTIYVDWSFCCCCCCYCVILLLFICNCGCTMTDEQQQQNYTVTTTLRTKRSI